MHIYLITVKEYGYNEYDGVAVAANTKQRAIVMALGQCRNFTKDNITVKHIGTSKKTTENIILDSFNAG